LLGLAEKASNAYLELIRISSTCNFGPDLFQLAPYVNSRLNFLGVLLRRVLEESCVTLPLEVRHNTIDQVDRRTLVERYRSNALVCQLRGDGRRSNGRLRRNRRAHLGTGTRRILARVELLLLVALEGRRQRNRDEGQARNGTQKPSHGSKNRAVEVIGDEYTTHALPSTRGFRLCFIPTRGRAHDARTMMVPAGKTRQTSLLPSSALPRELIIAAS
jgi:hypothetical protein